MVAVGELIQELYQELYAPSKYALHVSAQITHGNSFCFEYKAFCPPPSLASFAQGQKIEKGGRGRINSDENIYAPLYSIQIDRPDYKKV